ncbi:MAG: hypothetical protein AB1730_18250 [Myxococcota bacterium]
MRLNRMMIVVVLVAAGAWAQDGGVEEAAAPAGAPEAAVVPEATDGQARTPAAAAEPVPTQSMFDALAAEVRRLKEDIALPAPTYQGYAGMGPAASKVYFTPKGLSIGGYGEAYYSHDPAPNGRSSTDMLRVVLYAGYRFSDRIVFNSEIEFEHGSTDRGGAVSVEFAYLDFKLHDLLTVRVGNVLVPMGFVNEVHEPPFFFGVQRPQVERMLIPSTWNENGVGVYGDYKGLRYRGYLLNGMNATGDGRFSASSWVRGGRQGGALAIAENLAGVGSVEYSFEPVRIGVAGYFGRSGQGVSVDGRLVRGELFLGEAHAAFSYKGLSLRGLFVYGRLGDADLISAANGTTVGEQVLGGYAEAAYDVLRLLQPDGDMSLSPFVRFESFDTHKAVAPGFTRSPANSRNLVTAGLHFKPIANAVLKADWQHVFRGDGTQSDALNLGVGFVF